MSMPFARMKPPLFAVTMDLLAWWNVYG